MNKIWEESINNLLGSFTVNKENPRELEIRYPNCTAVSFHAFYKSVIEDKQKFTNGSLEYSIDYITDSILQKRTVSSNVKYIRKSIYNVEGTLIKTTFGEKVRINKINGKKYSISLSTERMLSTQFTIKDNDLVRFKTRVSFDIVGEVKWRLDMTAVHSDKISNLSKSEDRIAIKNAMFPRDGELSGLFDRVKSDMVTSYEIEIEYIGSKSRLTIRDLPDDIVVDIDAVIANSSDQRSNILKSVYSKLTGQTFNGTNISIKKITNQAMILTKRTWNEIYPPIGYLVTPKLDGVRVIIYLNGSVCKIIGKDINEYSSDSATSENVIIGDGELVDDTVHIFDLMIVDGVSMIDKPFCDRVANIDSVAAKLNGLGFAPIQFAAKQYSVISESNLYVIFKDVYGDGDGLDGLIITTPNLDYKNTKNYKWKPYSHMTIDFFAVLPSTEWFKQYMYKAKNFERTYILFVSVFKSEMNKIGIRPMPGYKALFGGSYDYVTGGKSVPIQFSPSINNLAYIYEADESTPALDHKIVELRRSVDGEKWEFVRIREDRMADKGYWGNALFIAEETYMNYIDKFEIEDLSIPSSYFQGSKSSIYKMSNAYKRMIIGNVIKKWCSGAKWIIDEAAGRGADLKRYKDVRVENALFIDRDTAAIAELVKRKFEIKGEFNMTVHTLIADLSSDRSKLEKEIREFKVKKGMVSAIICNFALHYMCAREETILNLLTMNWELLMPRGVFSFIVMNGKLVFDLLASVDEMYEVREGDVVKYAIRRAYGADEKFEEFGQNIEVLMPFAKEMYSEPLCNINIVVRMAKSLGFEVVYNSSLVDAANDPELGDIEHIEAISRALSADDMQYMRLHWLVVLQK